MGPCLAGCSLSFHQQECERGVGGRVPSSSKLYDWWHHWNCSCIRQQQPAITSRGRQKSKTKEERTRRTLLVLHTSPETGRARRTDENRIYGKSPGSRVHAGERVGMDVRSINSGACWANSCLTLDELLSYTHTHQPTDPPIERPKAAKRIYIRRTVPILLYILRMYKVDRGGGEQTGCLYISLLVFFSPYFLGAEGTQATQMNPMPIRKAHHPPPPQPLDSLYYVLPLLLLLLQLTTTTSSTTRSTTKMYPIQTSLEKGGKTSCWGGKKLKSKNMFANDISTCFWALIGSTTIPVPTDLL